MREQFLPFSPPLVGDEEVAGVVASIRAGWLTTGPRVATFQSRFAEYVGARAVRMVGRVLSQDGRTVPWHRVLRADRAQQRIVERR